MATPLKLLFMFFASFIFNNGVLDDLHVQASHHISNRMSLSETPDPPAYQPYRTGYHFQPAKNWINAPLFYKGIYHLFYQYNTNGAVWGNIVWAHSTSTDLINWDPQGYGIVPSQLSDINGTWSGSATFLLDGVPSILYTGINPDNQQVQNLAVPRDPLDPYLRDWVKKRRNPLMTPTHHNNINATSFRDPTTAWLGPDWTWRLAIGSKIHRRGVAILYRSKDFMSWEKVSRPLHQTEGTGMWECVDFFPVLTGGSRVGLDTSVHGPNVKHVLKVSFDDTKHDHYTIGKYDPFEDVYTPDHDGFADGDMGLRLDYGKYYASKTFFDWSKNRRILLGWVNESSTEDEDIRKGWAGVHTIPRRIWMEESGKQLIQWPVEEVEKLRMRQVNLPCQELKLGSVLEISGITAAQADVEISFGKLDLSKAESLNHPSWKTDPHLICTQMGASVKSGVGPFGLLVLSSNHLEEFTAVFFRVFKGENDRYVVLMCSDQSRSSLNRENDLATYGAFVDINPETENLSLRTLIDHSIVESFGGKGKSCITSRVYPLKAINEAAHVYAFNNGTQSVTMSRLSAWIVKGSHDVYKEYQSLESSPAKDQPYMPRFHFRPPRNWINGPMVHNGIYHLFYQYNPNGSVWGNIVWAHATSKDLVNWRLQPIAICPTEPNFDLNGAWSGSATILPNGEPVILYTGVNTYNQQVQNIAYPKNLSDPYLIDWTKPPHNPIMTPTPGNQINASSFRDPSTAWLGPDDTWRLVTGSKFETKGVAILYKSKDFKHWARITKPLHSAHGNGMWECPSFYPVSVGTQNSIDTSKISNGTNVKYVLKVSLDDIKRDYYTIGDYSYETDIYNPINGSIENGFSGLRYDYGKFYASKSFYDGQMKRRVLWGWVNESSPAADDVKKGWSGVMAVPRRVWLDRSGKQLHIRPVQELTKLRVNPVILNNHLLQPSSTLQVNNVTAAQADVEITFEGLDLTKAESMDPIWITKPQVLCNQRGASMRGSLGPFGLKVLASKDFEEFTSVFFRVFMVSNKPMVLMCSDLSRSSLDNSVDKLSFGTFVDVDFSHEKLSLRTLIDHSIVESFALQGKGSITARVYPKLAINKDANLYAFNGGSQAVKVSKLSAWSMKSAEIAGEY
ncbi:Beta-fructofuranosidase, insoluble isoenzyme CWINV1 [Linum grandiflorum]